jgi:hypothetical protein
MAHIHQGNLFLIIFTTNAFRELMEDKWSHENLNDTEIKAWLSFMRICKNFLGNHKAVNYQDVLQDF